MSRLKKLPPLKPANDTNNVPRFVGHSNGAGGNDWETAARPKRMPPMAMDAAVDYRHPKPTAKSIAAANEEFLKRTADLPDIVVVRTKRGKRTVIVEEIEGDDG